MTSFLKKDGARCRVRTCDLCNRGAAIRTRKTLGDISGTQKRNSWRDSFQWQLEDVRADGVNAEDSLRSRFGHGAAIVAFDFPGRVAGFLGYLVNVLHGGEPGGDPCFAEYVPALASSGG